VLSEQQISAAAADLDRAEQTRKQIKPLTLELRDMDMDDAYAVQKAWVDLKLARGASITGYKIGLSH